MYVNDHQDKGMHDGLRESPGAGSAGYGHGRGLAAPPVLVPRCRKFDVKVPRTHGELEESVRNWIATCVQSEAGPDGIAWHRERKLVTGNPTLMDIWNRILRFRVGQDVTLVPEYVWGPHRVESIRFATTAAPPPPPIRHPLPTPPSFDRAACYRFCDVNKVCCGDRTRMGGLQCQARWDVCRARCDEGKRWHFPDTDCRTLTESAHLGEPAAVIKPREPVFDLDCPPGACAPIADNRCRAVLYTAIKNAIWLATNAANKLEAVPRDKETVRLFASFFGHHPGTPVPWANNQSSGNSVALRFRKCAEELGGGRRTRYRCGCPGEDATVVAVTTSPNVVRLCPRFWNPPANPGLPADFFRAGTILHEMLHQLFIEFLVHDDNERRRNNAHCFASFAWRIAGFGARASAVRQCLARRA